MKTPVTNKSQSLTCGNYLATARAMMDSTNVTTDNTIKRAAKSDALYFFNKYRKK